jgi:prepilin-type N-terminal cleavage/methylation domain-containing protein
MLFTGVTSRKAKPTCNGFTIMELMVVLVILAILSAVALPNLRSGMRREQLTATSLRIANWLERARNQAVKDMESCEIRITADDAGDSSLAITSNSPGCGKLTTLKIGEQDKAPSEISLALLDNLDSEFIFSPRGSVNRDQEMELTMEGGPTTRCIKVMAPVGLVRSGIKRDGACRYDQELK